MEFKTINKLGLLLTAIGLWGCGLPEPLPTISSQQEAPAVGQLNQPLSPSGLRSAMSWRVHRHSGAYVLVGSDAQTNPYQGDTPVDAALPVLCIKQDGRPAPAGIPFDAYNGWAAGEVKLTAPLPGSVLVSPSAANAACARAFGSGYRMAEFHDGGGWNFWAQGTLSTTTRFWASINDQPANPWNASGDMPPPPYQETVVSNGTGWRLMKVNGYAADDAAQPYEANLYLIQNSAGIAAAPLSDGLQEDLTRDTGAGETVFVVDQTIAKDIVTAEATGKLTPALLAIAEPLDPTLHGDTSRLLGRCKNKEIAKNKSFNVTVPLSHSFSLSSGLTGTISATGTAQANATGEIQLALKRFGLFGVCIPYGVKFERARAYGTAAMSYGTTLNGTVTYVNPKPWEIPIAKPHLFSLDFFLGPIPIHVGFNLPILLGLDLQASVTGSISYTGSQVASGSFDYTCNLDGCTGGASYSTTGPRLPTTLTGGVSGRLQPSVYAQLAVRGYLFSEWFAYAQLGVRPYLHGDLWGYTGATCGDADENGSFESVKALTFDLDWQVFVNAEAAALGGSPKRWNDLWHTNRSHLGFWDLTTSSALSPLLSGPANAPLGLSQAYGARMRPCWPYTDAVTYQLGWGDGAVSTFSGPAATVTPVSHVWSTPGSRPLSLTAQRDAHGRVLNQSTARTIQVANATWTPWLNRDDAGGSGDWELLSNFVATGQACASPLAVECQTTSGVDWSRTGQVYSCGVAADGGVCKNADNGPAGCLDYQVRFLCP